MEEEKKKKRNKKKKNKQNNRNGEDIVAGAGTADAVSSSVEEHESLINEKNHQNEVGGTASAALDPPKYDTNGVEAVSRFFLFIFSDSFSALAILEMLF